MFTSVRLRVRLTEINRRAWLSHGLCTTGLLLALLAQRSIYDSGGWFPGILVYACAFALLAIVYLRQERSEPAQGGLALPIRDSVSAPPLAKAAHPARAILVLPAYCVALIAFLELSGNEFTVIGTTAWLLAILLFLGAFWEGSPRRAISELCAAFLPKSRWVLIALAGIMLVGGLFYFYRLDATPAEMTSDHAEKLLDTYDILNGARPIFLERNTGREPLQFYLNALVVALGIAPLDMLALKIVGAVAGFLTIPGVFLLAREMFDDDVGLAAAFLIAVSIFPVAIARVGLRYPLSPLFVAWTCFFLVRALRSESRNMFLLAGLSMGIGLNGYSPFRVVVLLAFAWCAIWLLLSASRKQNLSRYMVNVLLMFGAALLVFVPLMRYLTENPGQFAYRMATRLTSVEEPVPGDPLRIFVENNWLAMGMFNVEGDEVWVNAVTNVPAVDYIIGACFLLGIAYGAYRLIRHREYPFVLMFTALFLLLLPSTLALAFPEENPSVVRAGGVAPFVMIFAALPLALWRRQFERLDSRMLGEVFVGIVLVATVLVNFNLYFFRYDDQYRNAAWNSTEIAETLRGFALERGAWDHIYIVSAPHWVDYRAVGIHLGNFDFNSHLIEKPETLRLQVNDPAPKLYALKNQDLDSLLLLEDLYPQGISRRIESKTKGRDFVVFYTRPMELVP